MLRRSETTMLRGLFERRLCNRADTGIGTSERRKYYLFYGILAERETGPRCSNEHGVPMPMLMLMLAMSPSRLIYYVLCIIML